jgi:hypothetical protein
VCKVTVTCMWMCTVSIFVGRKAHCSNEGPQKKKTVPNSNLNNSDEMQSIRLNEFHVSQSDTRFVIIAVMRSFFTATSTFTSTGKYLTIILWKRQNTRNQRCKQIIIIIIIIIIISPFRMFWNHVFKIFCLHASKKKFIFFLVFISV